MTEPRTAAGQVLLAHLNRRARNEWTDEEYDAMRRAITAVEAQSLELAKEAAYGRRFGPRLDSVRIREAMERAHLVGFHDVASFMSAKETAEAIVRFDEAIAKEEAE